MYTFTRAPQYKFLPLLAMLSLTLSLLIHFFRQKFLLLNNIEMAGLIIPFWYLVNDLIAEVYGYKLSIKMFWCVVACEFIFLGMYYFLTFLPSQEFTRSSYYSVMGTMWDEIVINPFALWIAWIINAKLLINWKILLKGKYFWLRSMGSSIIAEIFFSLIIFLKLLFFYEIKHVLNIVIPIIIFRIFFTAFFSYPFSLIASLLKIIEVPNFSENSKSLNPFTHKTSAKNINQ